MTEQNWASREQRNCSPITPSHAREGTCHPVIREGKARPRVSQLTGMQAQVPSDSRLCYSLEGHRHKKLYLTATGYEDRDETVGARMPLMFLWGGGGTFPAPSQQPCSPSGRKLLWHRLQPPGHDSYPLGRDTTDAPLKIKPGPLPAPSGGL